MTGLTCGAFALLFLSDACKARRARGAGSALFALGALALAAAFVWALASQMPKIGAWTAVFLPAAGLCAWGEYRALFGCLPAKKTYWTGEPLAALDKGLYAVCRHPGAWCLFGMTGCAALALGSRPGMVFCALSTALNLLLCGFEDAYVFPRTLKGYEEYRGRVPFLLPALKGRKRGRGASGARKRA
jgi:protein-S-isoprenylcysteine O-methyltransferase Ste14